MPEAIVAIADERARLAYHDAMKEKFPATYGGIMAASHEAALQWPEFSVSADGISMRKQHEMNVWSEVNAVHLSQCA